MKRIYKKGLGLALAFALVCSPCMSALAADENDKQLKQDQIEALEQEKEQKNQELGNMQTDKANTESEMQAIDAQLTTVQEDIRKTNEDLKKAEEALEKTKADLKEAKEKEERQYETLKIRIKVMYEKGDTGYLEILLSADDMTSFLNSTEYISKISDYDSNLLLELTNTRQQIEALEKQQEEELAKVKELKAQLEVKEAELQKVLDEKAAYIVSLNQSISHTEENIHELEHNIEMEQAALAEIEAEIRAAVQAQEEAARQQAAQQQQSSGGSSGGGSSDSGSSSGGGSSYVPVPDVSDSYGPAPNASGWVWPSDTTYLTDTFGYQEWRGGVHNGIDIGAGYGSPIYAAASGTVYIAGYSNSAGNWVVINHGGGVMSVYMHASALYVSAGQQVSAGQTIAAVGSTGWSTGPHLHFGVMVGSSGGYDGYWVDPLGYVSP